jgi:hypothetical protein
MPGNGLLEQMLATSGIDLKDKMGIKDNNLEIVMGANDLKAILISKDPKMKDAVEIVIENNQIKMKFKLLG